MGSTGNTRPQADWQKNDPITAARLNAGQDRNITDVRVGPGLTMTRNGNAVLVALALQSDILSSLKWMKCQSDAGADNVAICQEYDGASSIPPDIPVLARPNLKANQLIYAAKVLPSVGTTYSGQAVTWLEITTGKGNMFPVGLVSDGGSAGADKTSKCTFTYTVKNLHGNTLATTVTPTGWGNGWSTLKLQLEAATSGMAYIDGDGSLKLLFWDEYPSHEQDCP